MINRESTSRNIFNNINVILMIILTIITLYPLVYVALASISSPSLIMAHRGPLFKPLGFSLESYRAVLENRMIFRSYFNTIFVVIVGVALNIVMTSFAAYFLSQKNIMLKNAIMFMIVFTMFFSGGLIPFYFTVKMMGLDNSLWVLIIPSAISTYNTIILRTAIMAVPDSMAESAMLDGANPFIILFKVIIPLVMPTIAVLILFYGVTHWNAWFNAMIFLRKRELYPLQLVLREILIENDTSNMTTDLADQDVEPISMTIKYAVIMVATIPILMVYPFLQKYFAKGVMIGALKG